MKIQYMSDLHLTSHSSFTIPDVGADVLVLAGDVLQGVESLVFAEKYASNYKAVIVVAGNHEFYGTYLLETLANMKSFSETSPHDNVFFLENDSVVVEGVRFIGSTMWSDLSNPVVAANAARWMNDYRIIYADSENYDHKLIRINIQPNHTTFMHTEAVRYIKQTLQESQEPCVVVTHHLPSLQAISAMYAGSNLNAAYASDVLPQLTVKPVAWIHGHSHETLHEVIDDVLLLRNPRGYHDFGYSDNDRVNMDFDPAQIVEISKV